jgi:hypothetical protein
MYGVSTTKRPNFGDVLNIGKWGFQVLGISRLLQEFKFSDCIFRVPHGPPLGHTNSAHVKVYWFCN